jgi:hypothetical protein
VVCRARAAAVEVGVPPTVLMGATSVGATEAEIVTTVMARDQLQAIPPHLKMEVAEARFRVLLLGEAAQGSRTAVRL